MARSTWKGPFYEEYLLKKADAVRKSGKTSQVIKIWTRRSTILPEFSNPDIFISFNKNTGRFKTKKADKPILMKHLFTHTSGIVYPLFTEDEFGRQGYLKANIQEAYPDMSITLEQNIINLSKVPLMHEPGEGWTYGMNMDVLGRVIEVLDGRPFARFMKEELFDPLKLDNTSFSLNESKWNNVSKLDLIRSNVS